MCYSILDAFFTYREKRRLNIHSVSLSVVYWSLMLGLAVGMVVYICYTKGYQEFSPVESAVTTKLHGLTFLNRSKIGEVKDRIWDNADYMIPPKENGAFTVITSFQVTPVQEQSVCDEDPNIPDAQCTQDSDCEENTLVIDGNGVKTGRCINSTHSPNTTVCEIWAWCPVEVEDENKRTTAASENFTVSVLNNVRFPEFGRKRQNVPRSMTREQFQTCVYNPDDSRNQHCPVFRLGTITKKANENFQDLVLSGAVIEMIIEWDCNFDCDDECLPSYSFFRLDGNENYRTLGFHMRYADHYREENGDHKRILYRAYGIRVVVVVHGQGRKFCFLTLLKTFGSLLSYFGFATIFVSIVVLGIADKCCNMNCCCFLPLLDEKTKKDSDKEGDDLPDKKTKKDSDREGDDLPDKKTKKDSDKEGDDLPDKKTKKDSDKEGDDLPDKKTKKDSDREGDDLPDKNEKKDSDKEGFKDDLRAVNFAFRDAFTKDRYNKCCSRCHRQQRNDPEAPPNPAPERREQRNDPEAPPDPAPEQSDRKNRTPLAFVQEVVIEEGSSSDTTPQTVPKKAPKVKKVATSPQKLKATIDPTKIYENVEARHDVDDDQEVDESKT